MKINILTTSFFEKITTNGKINNLTENQIKKFFAKQYFIYDIEKPEFDKYEISPVGGIFNPSNFNNAFFDESSKIHLNENHKMNYRKPDFFIFIIPLPSTNRTENLKTAYNCIETFSVTDYSFIKQKKFSTSSINKDLNSKINISSYLYKRDGIEQLWNSNCNPIIIHDHYYLFKLLEGYNRFLKEVLHLKLSIKSIRNMVTPFFELSEDEIYQISKL